MYHISSVNLRKNETTSTFEVITDARSVLNHNWNQNDQWSYLLRISVPPVLHICCCLFFFIFFVAVTVVVYVKHRQQVTRRKLSKV